jgi:hypothetical protein
MTGCRRVAASLAAATIGLLLLAAASVLVALASVGAFATGAGMWTTELRFAGLAMQVNVPALLRLATLPGVVQVLDGRSIKTGAGNIRMHRDGRALRLRCAPCRWEHADLAAAPVQLRTMDLTVARRDDALDGALVIDGVTVTYSGRLRPEGVVIAWQLPPTDVARVVAALGDAVPEASFARIEGRLNARGTLALPTRSLAVVDWSTDAIEVGGLGTEALQHGWFRFGCGQRDGTARLVVTGDGERPWVATDAMGPYLAAAVMAAEDQRFRQHPGYDPEAITAILASVEQGRPRRGASTITQQLARTLFTGGEKTAVRKLRELLYAVEMERTLGKARILELYLNTVDWGPGLCGAKAAARAYFNKPPARLSAIEAAWLASVLRNPHTAWALQFAARQPDRARATAVLTQMRDWPKRERQRFAQQPLAFAIPQPSGNSPARPLRAQAGVSPRLQATR